MASELEQVERELQDVRDQLSRLRQQEEALSERRQTLRRELKAKEEGRRLAASVQDWTSSAFPWSQKAEALLRGTFNLPGWRPNQKEVVNASMSGRDTFVVMRTGGGKSLCYQLPAVLRGGITVAISPLISLMQDQVQLMNALFPGAAAMITGAMDRQVASKVYGLMKDKDGKGNALRLIFVTPEKISKSKQFMAALDAANDKQRLAGIVVDEAHCCSQWGHDFRPDYTKLGILKRQYPHVPLMAVTATCTGAILGDVCKILGISHPDIFRSSFNRPNLYYEVQDKPEKLEDAIAMTAAFIEGTFPGQAGIVYCFSRKETETVALGLSELGISAGCYHAAMDNQERSNVQQRWGAGKLQVVVATIAFGMGINKLDCRFVVHFSLSKSVESYYQESGRAGRDGEASGCLLLYRASDASRQATLSCSEPSGVQVLRRMVSYCQNLSCCRRALIAQALGDPFDPATCRNGCDVCRGRQEGAAPPESKDMTVEAREVVAVLRVLAGKEQRVTSRQLADAWRTTGKKALPCVQHPPRGLSREMCERFLHHLLCMDILADSFHFTAYSVVPYVTTGARAHATESGQLEVLFDLPSDSATTSKAKNLKAAKTSTSKQVDGKTAKAARGPTGVKVAKAGTQAAPSATKPVAVDLCSSSGQEESDDNEQGKGSPSNDESDDSDFEVSCKRQRHN